MSVGGIARGRWCRWDKRGIGRRSVSVSREAVAKLNHCIRLGTDRQLPLP